METLTVKIGNLILYKFASWEEVLKTGNVLSKCFNYMNKTWTFDPSRFNGNEDIIHYLSKIFSESKDVIRRAIVSEVQKYEDKKEKELKSRILNFLNSNKFAVAPTTVLSKQDKSKLAKLFSYHRGFYVLDPDKLVTFVIANNITSSSKLVKSIVALCNSCNVRLYPEQVGWLRKNASSLLARIKPKIEERTTIILREREDFVEVTMGRRLTKAEFKYLLENFSVDYYTIDMAGNLKKHRMRVIKYDKTRGTYVIPFFCVDRMKSVAKTLKFENIIDKISWVEDKIDELPKFDIKLYEFQKTALSRWIKAGCRGTIVVPTGGGKTYIGMAALHHLKVPTLICVTTIELANQWIQKLEEHLGIEAGLLGGGHHDVKQVTVAIYNSAAKKVGELRDKFDLIIFDEVHHIPADLFRNVAFKLKARKRLGLSATPKRYDRNEALIFFSVGNVVYVAKYSDMVKLKLAAPLKFYRVYVGLTQSELEKYSKESLKSGARKIQKMMEISFTASEKYDALKRLVERLNDNKILVFCQYIRQAEKSYKVLRRVVGSEVALLTGNTNSKRRKRYFEQFKEGKKRIIVTTTVLDEGIDVPDADVGIIMSGTGTERQMIQRIGRVIRYRPNKVAKVVEIVTKNTVEETIADRRVKVLEEYGIKPKFLKLV